MSIYLGPGDGKAGNDFPVPGHFQFCTIWKIFTMEEIFAMKIFWEYATAEKALGLNKMKGLVKFEELEQNALERSAN